MEAQRNIRVLFRDGGFVTATITAVQDGGTLRTDEVIDRIDGAIEDEFDADDVVIERDP